ncbi:MAG: hypothetical protein ACKO3W_15465 [bacterium]
MKSHERYKVALLSHSNEPSTEASATPPDASAGLWAYLAEVRVIVHGECQAVTRRVRGLFCAKNHHEARAHALALAAEKARRIGHVMDVRLTRIW